MAKFIKTIQNFASQNDLWAKDAKIVVGVSGGPDSVCLLAVLAELAPKYGFQLHIAHVNYGLRDKDSDQEELFVQGLGKKYGMEMSVLTPKKGLYKGNLENRLRQIRYEYFEKIRQQKGFGLIAVAHNRDDQAETVLMRIIRGAGLQGLSAMKAKTGQIIRPLLQTSRADISAHLKQKKLKYRIDKTNADIEFTRNKVRHNLLPYLEKNFNPSVKKTLSSFAQSVADDYAFIGESAERFAKGICKNKCAHFSARAFGEFPIAIQRQVFRNIFQKLKGGTFDVENQQIEEIIKVVRSTKSKNQKALIGGLNVLKKGDKVDIS